MRSIHAWIAIVLLLAGALAARTEDDPRLRTDIDKALADHLYRELQARQGCKIKICEIARTKEPTGGDVACKVLKTWPAIDLKTKILKGKFDWPWGNAECETDLSLARNGIIAAMTQPKYEAKIGKHQITCRIQGKDGQHTQTIQFTIEPVVTFENGKATKASLHWGEVTGSKAAKSALWSMSALDNVMNVLQGTVVEQINEFFGPKCDDALANHDH